MKRSNVFPKTITSLVIAFSLISVGLTSVLSAKVTHIKFAEWNALKDPYNYVKAFEKANPDIKVDFTLIPEAEYSQKINTMAITGNAPDVMVLWECDITRLAKAGLVIPLDEHVKQTKTFSMDDFIPAVGNLIKSQGKIYGFPWCFATEILYYNKDVFDKAGLAYPDEKWTWKDFENAAKKLTIVKDGKVVQWGCDSLNFQGLWYSLIGTAGDEIVNEKGQFSIGNGAKEFLQWWYNLTNKDKVVPSPQTAVGGVTSDLFMAGKAAMAFNGSWMTSVYKDIKDFGWDIAPIPKEKRQYSTLHTGFFTIYVKSKVKDAAWRFIEFCMSGEGQEVINKAGNNPSARISILKKGYYKVYGPKGPTRWDAIEKTAQFAQWGYVLLPPGLSFDVVKDFHAVILGQMSIDDALKRAMDRGKEILGEKGVAE